MHGLHIASRGKAPLLTGLSSLAFTRQCITSAQYSGSRRSMFRETMTTVV